MLDEYAGSLILKGIMNEIVPWLINPFNIPKLDRYFVLLFYYYNYMQYN